jgi:hypothetical protein
MNNLVSRPQLLARTKEDLLDLDETLATGLPPAVQSISPEAEKFLVESSCRDLLMSA